MMTGFMTVRENSYHPILVLVVYVRFFSSRHIFELNHRTAEVQYYVRLGLVKWIIDSGITLAALAEESLTQAYVQAPSQLFPGSMTKPALPV